MKCFISTYLYISIYIYLISCVSQQKVTPSKPKMSKESNMIHMSSISEKLMIESVEAIYANLID
jgi:hypothetical protein